MNKESENNFSDLFPSLTASREYFPQGNLNISLIVVAPDGTRLISRRENPLGRKLELPFITAEYQGVGFLDNPQNGFHLRTPMEQHEFADALRENEVNASRTIWSDHEKQLIIYENNAISLDQLWSNRDIRAITATETGIMELAEVHKKGFVLGDRWGPNELLTPDGIMFVDFDIEIFGPEAKEFEMASMLYFLTYFAQPENSLENLDKLAAMYEEILDSTLFNAVYDKQLLSKYLANYFSYFTHEGKYRWHDQDLAKRFRQIIT